MYLGPENQCRAGESLVRRITGAAGWLFRGITEFMLGMQADYDGLVLRPCLSRTWKEVFARREYRGAVYLIEIKNFHGLETGALTILVDGQKISGNTLPVFSDGREHQVSVTLS